MIVSEQEGNKMKKSKQYEIRIVQDDASWVAELIRRVTTKKTVVTKRQDGFATESDAQAWGQGEVKAFTQKRHLNKSNKRKSNQPEWKQ